MGARATRRKPVGQRPGRAPTPCLHRPRTEPAPCACSTAWARCVAPRWPSLDPDRIVRAAARAAKSDQFGDESFRDALPVLFDSIEREADLSWLGRVMFRQSLLGFLQNRFSVYRYRATHPEVAGVPIERPSSSWGTHGRARRFCSTC